MDYVSGVASAFRCVCNHGKRRTISFRGEEKNRERYDYLATILGLSSCFESKVRILALVHGTCTLYMDTWIYISFCFRVRRGKTTQGTCVTDVTWEERPAGDIRERVVTKSVRKQRHRMGNVLFCGGRPTLDSICNGSFGRRRNDHPPEVAFNKSN